jgi:uncharacterized protein (TIGR03437 family)
MVAAFAACAALSWGQTTFDSSGDAMLNGKYFVRQVLVNGISDVGIPSEAIMMYGTITFDGAGNYTLTGTKIDSTVSSGAPQSISFTGTYAIGANGTGYIDNPVISDTVYGAVGQGVFVGSSTEGLNNDILIAIPAASTPATNASFNGTFSLALIDFPGADASQAKNALTQLTPNGQGALGGLSISGFALNQSSQSMESQTAEGASYSFGADGTATLTIPTPSGVSSTDALFSGSKMMAISSDTNFILGGSTTGYDIFFGVRALSGETSQSTLSGLYYLGGLESYPDIGDTTDVDSFYGSINSNGAGTQIEHNRICPDYASTYDWMVDNETTLNSDGTMTDAFGFQYAFGNGGNSFVGIGPLFYASLTVGVHAPTFTPSGSVWLNPVGVANAASYSPITMSISPGELISLYGQGLSSGTQSVPGGQPFPTKLNNVQVLINGRQAPVYYVSSTQISAIVPYASVDDLNNGGFLATVQVNNNGTLSNPVTVYLDYTSPGVFTTGQNGVGDAAALQQDYSLVSSTNPAKSGNYVSIYLTGLGTVTPTVTDGAPGPSNPLSYADVYNNNGLYVYLDDPNNGALPMPIEYAGLAPGFAGLYQINVQVPSGVTGGETYIEIDIADSYGDLVQIANQVQLNVSQ